jgi:predicted RNase H-like HicB family nuclease
LRFTPHGGVSAQTFRQTSGVALGRGGDYNNGMKFRVIIEPDEDGVFVAECPALSGCVSQGQTRDEAMANIRDAIQGYLHSLEIHGEPVPGPVTEAIIEVPV